MRIISRKKLREFWTHHPKSRSALEAWFQVARRAKWKKFADVRATLRSADRVGRFIVFNVGGNKYRLIVVAHFNRDRLYIRHVLTHAEYDSEQWKDG